MGGASKLDQLPDEMFTLIKSTSHTLAPRLGRLTLPGRKIIDTPHYLGNTSRGVVPHITQDTFRRDTNISGVYVGLEDFIERSNPPLFQFRPPDNASPLRCFTALPNDTVLVVGARRTPTVASPAANSNTDTTIAVCTSVGFKSLKAKEYAENVEKLGADIVVALGDVPYGRALGNKRVEKATDRNIQWLQDHVALREEDGKDGGKLFASLLPVSCAKQQYFVNFLAEEMDGKVAGLAIFNVVTLEDLSEDLGSLPKLGFTTPSSPHEVLQQIDLGIDLLVIPFIGAATDAGIALDFSFPPSISNGSEPVPLGVDMWSTSHATDISPLAKDCKCYACTKHHRAYLQHLLMAKEMLGWVLLQIHNHHTMDLFFAGVRQSLARDTFEEDVRMFEKTYEPRLPEKTGQGPRVRGYQFKAEGPGEPKKNTAPFTTLNDGKEKLAEATPLHADVDADDLQSQGFAEKT